MALTVIYAYYDNAKMLEKHLTEWEQYPTGTNIILVDDASPKYPAYEIVKDWPVNLRLYRVTQNIPWNQNGARNLAMKVCETQWALMLDMDHLLPHGDALKALGMRKYDDCYYVPLRYWPNGDEYRRHPNSFLLTVDKFWECGGYDEDFCGHYGSDSVFRMALNNVARRVETDKFKTIHYEGIIEDANTTELEGETRIRKGGRFHSRKDKYLLQKRNSAPYKAENPIRFDFERLI